MDKTIIAPVGDQHEALFPALREFSVEHVHLLTHPDYEREAAQLEKDLDRFGIPHTAQELGDNIWESTFTAVSGFAEGHPKRDRIVVHVGVGDRQMQCAATTASFVNGLHAVNGNKDMMMGLPIMRFSYYKLLNDRKFTILEHLEDEGKSMLSIADELGISLSLLSYHVHGNRKSEGLIDMGLAGIEEDGGQMYLHITPMGRLLRKGVIPQKAEA